MSLKKRILNSLIDKSIENDISINRISPTLSSIYAKEGLWLSNIFTTNAIPFVSYKTDLSNSNYTENLSKLISIISSISTSSTVMYSEHKELVTQYNLLYRRIKERIPYFKNIIDEILGYSCRKIDVGYGNQTDISYVGKIGKYITLPFFMNSTKLYNGYAKLSVVSSGIITFSNFESINKLPFPSNPSLKITSSSQDLSLKITSTFDKSTMNAFYLKIDNKIISMTVDFNNSGVLQYSEKFKTNEILTSFDPIQCDSIVINIALKNTNTDKPLSIQVDNMYIFNDIQFSKYGIFESKNKDLGPIKSPSSLALSYLSTGSQASVWPMLSISMDQESISYNNIIKDTDIDISSYKFKYDFKMDNFISKDLSGKTFDTKNILESDNKWEMDYKNSIILYGVNNKYMSQDSLVGNNLRFNNWTKIDNYYKTMILNYQDDVSVNIGALKCIINGREFTGNIKIPIGLSLIEVHSKDIDLDFGSLLSKEDTSNPYNFAYIFSGIPDYEDNAPVQKIKEFDISNSNVVELGGSFIPFTEVVSDGYGNIYSLSLCKIPNTPGTYTIEPYSGRIKIKPISTVKNITISYIPTNPNRKSAGILFNRLLTFTNIETLISSLNSEDLSFSFNGSSSIEESPIRYLILPNTEIALKDSYILYNMNNDRLYTSTKIKLSTDNKYKTPTISDIYLAVK